MSLFTLRAGTPLWKRPTTRGVGGAPNTDTSSVLPENTDEHTTEFVGVTTRNGEIVGDGRETKIQRLGDCLARVEGPCSPADAIGLSVGNDWFTTPAGEDGMTGSGVGLVLDTISDDSVKLCRVRLGTGGGSDCGKCDEMGNIIG